MENKMDTVTLGNKKEEAEMKYEQIGLDLGFDEVEETMEKEKIEMTERTKEELMSEEKKVKVEALDKMSQAYYNAIVYLEDNWTDRPSDDIAYKAILKAYRDTSKQSIELLEEIEEIEEKETKESINMRNSEEKQTLTQEERMFKLVKGIVNDELTLKQVVAVLDTFDGDMIVRTYKNLKFVNKKTAYMNLQFVKDVNKDTGGLEQVDTVLRGMEYRYPVLNQSTEKPKKEEKTKKETSNTQGALSEEEVVRELVSGYLNRRLNKDFVVKASKGLNEENQKHLLSLFVKAGKRLSESTKVSDKERKAYQTMLLDIIEDLSPVEEGEESKLVTKGGEVVESVKEKLGQWKETYLNKETKEKATNRFKEGYNKTLDKLKI